MMMNADDNCQFCSVVSKANGEDPIGSAMPCDRFLAIELPLPWLEQHIKEHPIARPVLETIQLLKEEQGISVRLLAIAPDREYSHPAATRVLYYERPANLFAKYAKQEFILPSDRVASLVTALLAQPEQISQFESYRQDTNPIRELAICTHGNVDVACARFGYPIYKKLRTEYAQISEGKLRVWRCSHFGGHRFAPTLVDLPQGRYWGHLEIDQLDGLVQHRGAVNELRPFYRGWAGLKPFEQMVEREIWMREGWDWLDYLKIGRTLSVDDEQERADVCIDFISPDGQISGSYEARVEVSDRVMTMMQSGDRRSMKPAKQYRVSQLTQKGVSRS